MGHSFEKSVLTGSDFPSYPGLTTSHVSSNILKSKGRFLWGVGKAVKVSFPVNTGNRQEEGLSGLCLLVQSMLS